MEHWPPTCHLPIESSTHYRHLSNFLQAPSALMFLASSLYTFAMSTTRERFPSLPCPHCSYLKRSRKVVKYDCRRLDHQTNSSRAIGRRHAPPVSFRTMPFRSAGQTEAAAVVCGKAGSNTKSVSGIVSSGVNLKSTQADSRTAVAHASEPPRRAFDASRSWPSTRAKAQIVY
jgi:hypothetical protein